MGDLELVGNLIFLSSRFTDLETLHDSLCIQWFMCKSVVSPELSHRFALDKFVAVNQIPFPTHHLDFFRTFFFFVHLLTIYKSDFEPTDHDQRDTRKI
jgi:hypothetical protein